MFRFILPGLFLMAALQPSQAATSGLYFAAPHTVSITDNKAEIAKIQHLISYVSSLEGATFIRNGSAHSCQEAAEHLQAKWKKHSDKIKTAEDFIKKLASHSGMTGDVYQIRFADGSIKPTKEILLQELQRLNSKVF